MVGIIVLILFLLAVVGTLVWSIKHDLNAYCELMAKFKFESEAVMLKEAEKMKNTKSYLKSIEVHDILDMSDCVDLCNANIEKTRAEKDGNEQEEKPKKRTRKKVKDESESGEN